MSSLADLETELAEVNENVEFCQSVLDVDEDAAELLKHWQSEAKRLQLRIVELNKQAAPPPPPSGGDGPPPPPPPSAVAPPPPPPSADDSRVIFNTGDQVMAKFSEDKQWYQASIISKTGSSNDPIYTVKFIGYGNKETKRKFEVRPMENKKRKADGTSATSTPPIPPSPKPIRDAAVISAAPSVDLAHVQKHEPSKVSDGPTRMAPAPKKLKTSKALEKTKNSWMDWQKTGPKRSGIGGAKMNKESQFRTSNLPNAKVGFTGSGKPMQKDQARTKWTYGEAIEDPDD